MEDHRTRRSDLLNEANELIHGDRNAHYGHPTINFDRIAAIWNVLLGPKLNAEITPAETADMMIGVKLARNVEAPKRDNYADIAGYAACGWEAHLHTVTVADIVPEICEDRGPRVGSESPLCVRPKGHTGVHVPDESWFPDISQWV